MICYVVHTCCSYVSSVFSLFCYAVAVAFNAAANCNEEATTKEYYYYYYHLMMMKK